MLQVDTKNARPGMTLALPVRNPQSPDRFLLAAGYELQPRDVARLPQLGVRGIMVRYPGLDVVDKFINPRLLEQRGDMCQQLRSQFERVQQSTAAKLPYDTYLSQMAGLVEELLHNRSSILLVDQAGGNEPWLMQHATAVAYLSVMIGIKIESYLIKQRPKLAARNAKDVTHLGLGGMLHDVGMMRLDEPVLDRYRRTHDANDPDFQEHVTIGFGLVRGNVEPSAAAAVLHHHQAWDGGGYPVKTDENNQPQPLSGTRIHIFARIVAAADLFSELRHAYDAEPIPAVRALRTLLSEPNLSRLDPNVVKGLLTVVPPYSPAMPVKLSDGRWAVPLEHDPEDPCRPTVQIIADPGSDAFHDGPSASDAIVDLAKTRSLSVVEAEGEDVSGDNFDPPDIAGLIDRAEAEQMAA